MEGAPNFRQVRNTGWMALSTRGCGITGRRARRAGMAMCRIHQPLLSQGVAAWPRVTTRTWIVGTALTCKSCLHRCQPNTSAANPTISPHVPQPHLSAPDPQRARVRRGHPHRHRPALRPQRRRRKQGCVPYRRVRPLLHTPGWVLVTHQQPRTLFPAAFLGLGLIFHPHLPASSLCLSCPASLHL